MHGGEADAKLMEMWSVRVPYAAGGSGTLCLQRGFALNSWSGFGASRLKHFTVGSDDLRDGDDCAQMRGQNIARERPRIMLLFLEMRFVGHLV